MAAFPEFPKLGVNDWIQSWDIPLEVHSRQCSFLCETVYPLLSLCHVDYSEVPVGCLDVFHCVRGSAEPLLLLLANSIFPRNIVNTNWDSLVFFRCSFHRFNTTTTNISWLIVTFSENTLQKYIYFYELLNNIYWWKINIHWTVFSLILWNTSLLLAEGSFNSNFIKAFILIAIYDFYKTCFLNCFYLYHFYNFTIIISRTLKAVIRTILGVEINLREKVWKC